MKIFKGFGLVLGLSIGAVSTALGQVPAAPEDFVGDAQVLAWNAIASDTVSALPPVPSARFLAITELAVFEAVNAITAQYEPYLGTVVAPSGASAEAAAASAAHGVLEAFFPAAAATLDQELAESLATIPDGPSKAAGILVGEDAAALVLAERTGDGSETPEFHLPPDLDPGDWQPTPSCTAAGGAFKHWQNVAPFGIESSTQFRAAPPYPFGSRPYARDYREVKAVGSASSTERSQDRTDVARFYAAQSAPIGWNSVARQLASRRHDGITRTARTLALLNAAISDSLITVFESKYHYDVWRPETAIARADEDGNPQTEPDATFTPLVVAPCFPSYPSGHGAAAGAGSTVLAAAYGEGPHEITHTTPTLPDIVLHYGRLDQIVSDVSDARVYGGIHFRSDQDAAKTLGSRVAAYDLEHLLPELDGNCDHE